MQRDAADRVKWMADLLEMNSDELAALAGRVPDDLAEINQESPIATSDLLRAVRGMPPDQISELCKLVARTRAKNAGKTNG